MLYGDSFYNYIENGSKVAADAVISVFHRHGLNPQSVLDVGCGRGAWLARWQASGAKVFGLDGAHVDQQKLMIPKASFRAQDLSTNFDVLGNFDLVQCMEVAEHLPPQRAAGLVHNLVKNADMVLFSAAVPGQGGEHHINEQPLEYWRKLFENEGYITLDLIRPSLLNAKKIPPWYRFNSLLYVKAERFDSLGESLRAYRVKPGRELQKYGDLVWKIRLGVLKQLPVSFITQMSILQHRLRNFLRVHG
jgi:SAM-dependent methyltransferase